MVTLPLLMAWFGCAEVRKRPGQLLSEVSLNLIQLAQVFSASRGKKFGKRGRTSLWQLGSSWIILVSNMQICKKKIKGFY